MRVRVRSIQFIFLCFVLSLSAWGGGGNGGGTQPAPAQPDFAIGVSATSLNLRQGGASSPVTVSITPQNGFSSTDQVSFTGLPNGVTTSPAPPFSISMRAASYGNSRRHRHSRCAQRAVAALRVSASSSGDAEYPRRRTARTVPDDG